MKDYNPDDPKDDNLPPSDNNLPEPDSQLPSQSPSQQSSGSTEPDFLSIYVRENEAANWRLMAILNNKIPLTQQMALNFKDIILAAGFSCLVKDLKVDVDTTSEAP